jgi:hypothetical protein
MSTKQEELQALVDWIRAYVALSDAKSKNHYRPVQQETYDQYESVVKRLKETLGAPDLEV